MGETIRADKVWQGEIISRRKDDTERKRAENEMACLVSYPQLNPNPVLECDADGRILYTNPAASRLLESRGTRDAFELFHPHNFPQLVKRALAEKTPIYGQESRVGSQTLLWALQPLPEQKRVRAYGVDITERKQLEVQFHQAQKMEAVGKLAGGVAHDFNNILNVILGYTDLVLDDLKADDPSRQRLKEIRKAAERATSLTRQLLAFSRKQVFEPQVLDLNSLVQGMEEMVRRLIGEDIELLPRLLGDLGRVKADPSQLEQVMLNLAVNARDAMPQGGKLTIETANAKLDENYARAHYPCQPGSYVMLAVSDTGHGMDKETQAHIFEPFYTTKEKGKGTGLGLATVYGIVKQSNGFIWVYSEPGKGTTFKVYLPRIEEEAKEVSAASVAEALPRKGGEGKTVLIAEDEEPLRMLTREFLEAMGYQVLEGRGTDSAEAVRIAEEYDGPIHLLITDVVMPGMSGRQLAEQVAARRPNIKVLYVSGYPDNTVVHHGVLDEGLNFLQKPFTLSGLARKLNDLLLEDEGTSST